MQDSEKASQNYKPESIPEDLEIMHQEYDEDQMDESYMQAVGVERKGEEQLNMTLLRSLNDSNENENREKEKEQEKEKETEKEKKTKDSMEEEKEDQELKKQD